MIDIALKTSETVLRFETPNAKRRDFLTPIPDLVGEYLLVLDNTALEKIVRCPTAGHNYLILGREPWAKNAALTFGGAIHDGIEAFYKGLDPTEQDAAIVKYFVENPTPPDEYRTVQNALMVMNHYREQTRIREDYKEYILSDDLGLIIERPFELPLGVLEFGEDNMVYLPVWGSEPRLVTRVHVAWAGRIDRLTNQFAKNRVTDVKTTSIKGDQFIQGFQLSSQTIGYVWAARQMWPEFDILDFNLDAIFFKKPTGSNGLMERGPRGGEPPLDFFRANFDYSPARIDEWAANTLTIVEDFVHDFVRDFYPMYTFHCFNKFGKCPYHDVCTIDNRETRDRFLKSDAYKEVTWDPTIGR